MGMGGMEHMRQMPEGESEGQASADNTFYLPQDFPNTAGLKPGDTITLRVKAVEEGEVEVEPMANDTATGSEPPPLADDIRQTMGE